MKDLNGESPLSPLIEGGNKNEIQVPLIASSLKTRGIEGDSSSISLIFTEESLSETEDYLRTQEKFKFNTIPEVIDDIKQGKMVILVDDEDRENEGDLIIPADKVTPEIITFMAKKGSGLICLPMNKIDLNRLNLPQMVSENTSRRATAFSISIEAKEGVTTGISAFDRAHTIKTAVNPTSKPEDIARPGHIFPLEAKDSILLRPGQTEGSVELAHMAGFSRNAVLCEIMDEDGNMARLPQLFQFADKYNMKITTIKDLIIYKLRNEKLIRKLSEQEIEFTEAKATMFIYKSDLLKEYYIAVTFGNISNGSIPAFLHKQNVVSDVIEIILSGGNDKGILEFIDSSIEKDKGVFIFLCNETIDEREYELSSRYNENREEIGLSDKYMFKWLRNLGITSQILKDLSINNIEIQKFNMENINEISKFGIQVEQY
jgi:3,4-dihydroxy 2-butanone 4-phosphate synthase/GTP cyclohydrolase II